ISPMPAARHLTTLDAAISWVNGNIARLPAETVPLLSASHRVLAQDIHAAHPIPLTDRAALDGFAVMASATVERVRTTRCLCRCPQFRPVHPSRPVPTQ